MISRFKREMKVNHNIMLVRVSFGFDERLFNSYLHFQNTIQTSSEILVLIFVLSVLAFQTICNV